MLTRRLQPGNDYLLDVTLLALWRELPASLLHADLEHFRAASHELGFTAAVSRGAAGLVCARLLIQTGRPLRGLTDQDIAGFDQALRERQQRTGRCWPARPACGSASSSTSSLTASMRCPGRAPG